MSASLSPTRIFKCDGCQATLPYDPARAGQKCRCGQCGKVLVVPAAQEAEPPVPPSAPSYIEFWCHVCDTRLVAHAADAGRKAKCFECGAINRVPKPRVVEKPREPAAMHGQQYGIWEVNKAPDPDQLRAAQARLFPVYCRVCDTLMYAQPQHVGGKLKCPDCGALTTVKEPPKPPEKKSVLVPAGQEYQLDPNQLITAGAVPDYVERLKQTSKLAVEEQAKREAEERPPMPKFPTFVGVWPMLVRDPVVAWWGALSLGGIAVAWLLVNSVVASSGGGFAQIFALLCRILGAIGFVLWYGPTAAILCAIAADSSDGLKRLHSEPSMFFVNCFPEMGHVFLPLSLSLAPGFALMRFTDPHIWLLAAAASWLLLFPVLLLSTFHHNTPMGVFAARIWGSVLLRPAHWFVFYVQSAIIAAATAVTIVQIALAAPEWILTAVPIALAGAFVYFRVLGRFAWWLSESLSEQEIRPEPRYKRF
jgi:DNA-directed RNA polymerase subunit M/transcription elongation factor TFIIS